MKKSIRYILSALFFALFAVAIEAQTSSAKDLGIPFFKTFSATEYGAHSRNFDILCDSKGRVYIANFEGLLVYDGEEWEVMHTPGISRVTSLHKGQSGKIWFGGNNVLGYVSVADSIKPVFVTDESNRQLNFGEVRRIEEGGKGVLFTTAKGSAYTYTNGKVKFMKDFYDDPDEKIVWNGIDINERLDIKDFGMIVYATVHHGLIITDMDGQQIYNITEANGLCSNIISAIAYDGKGSVWGTTNNGIFVVNVSSIYTHYGEMEGLKGHVTSILKVDGKLLVGTLQGLYELSDATFHKVPGVDQACWKIVETKRHTALTATADGVFEYKNGSNPVQITTKHTLALYVEDENSFLMGNLDGIYRHTAGKGDVLINKIQNVVKFDDDGKGNIWALTLYGETYIMPKDGDSFQKKQNDNLTLMLNYTDDNGVEWKTRNNGNGLTRTGTTDEMESWLRPFDDCIVQAMMVSDDVAWIGGNFGLYRFDIGKSKKSKHFVPKVDIRYFMQSHRLVNFCVANDNINILGKTLYSYRLKDGGEWSKWRTDQDIELSNMAYGRYQLTVRSMDPYGQISVSETKNFEIPFPIFVRWYFLLLYLLLLGLALYAIGRYRMQRLVKERKHLEQVVKERTQEVVKQKNEIVAQKNEIEQKSHELEDALKELRATQQQLIRKEHEATVGKLTKGLIDRILNPMNYINNFSHLTIGLAKDLKENLEDDEDKMTPDNFEDSMDVIDMMSTNLEKIEQHGLSTTRTLKAMEEMLKDRSNKIDKLDIAAICQQNIDMVHNYFKDDISRLGISIEWNRPDAPVMANVNADLLSRTFMSMLANSVFAVNKKAEKAGQTGYQPVIRLTITPGANGSPTLISIYDNGIGIEESIIDKIFDPFFTTKPTAEAPGVGLYLSQQTIQDFGGTITVKSTKDEYTEFTISLP